MMKLQFSYVILFALIAVSQSQSINQKKMDVTCYYPAEVGSCDGKMARYYYDKVSKTCRKFTYGGCGGNANNFASKQDCAKACRQPSGSYRSYNYPVNPEVMTAGDAKPLTSLQARCYLIPKAGSCMAYIQRYYYDPKASTCKQFIYGGCGGNANNFATKEECLYSCRPNAPNENTDQVVGAYHTWWW